MSGRRTDLVLAVVFLVLPAAACAAAVAPDGGPAPKEPTDKRFQIAWAFNAIGQVGFKVKEGDQWQPITYSYQGNTNVALVRIEGQEDAVYGWQEEMKAALLAGPNGDPPQVGKTYFWRKGKITVAQEVKAYQADKETYDVCLVRYTFKNDDDVDHKVGLRFLLDTLIVDNDACAFLLPEAKTLIVDKAEFPKDGPVPEYFTVQQFASLKKPGVQAVLTLKVGAKDWLAPDRVLITHFPARLDQWQVPVESIRNDSVVVMYWGWEAPHRLRAKGELSCAFAYGLKKLTLKNKP